MTHGRNSGIKSFKSICLAATVIFFASSAAFANNVTLQLVNVGPGNNDGSYYVYPYNFSVNSSPLLVSLLCDDFHDDISFGESWVASRYTLADIFGGAGQMNPSGGLVTGGNRVRAYKEAAWLFDQLVANPTSVNAVGINHTIWGLFTSTPFNGNADTMNWFGLAEAATLNLTDQQAQSMFADVVFYTPVSGTQPSGYGQPQEMIGTAPVPEPASFALIGVGVLGLAAIRRRAKRQTIS